MTMIRRFLCLFLVVLAVASAASGQSPTKNPATLPAGKTVRLLAIGNSFSVDATAQLRLLAEAGGHRWVFRHAMIGGSPLERHARALSAYEADPNDPAGSPYRIAVGKEFEMRSLRELLESDRWEFVTIQQASNLSYRWETFEPHASVVVAAIRKYAPQAKVLIHETWAYRADHALFQPDGFTQQQMYSQLSRNYRTLAANYQTQIIPVGTAFQNVREDPRWKPAITPNVDPSTFVHPASPKEDHELNIGYSWSSRTTPPQLLPDRGHATTLGRYLGACVWYEHFFGDVRPNPYRPTGLNEDDAALMREIAHRTVHEGLAPKPTTLATTLPVIPAAPLPALAN